MDELRQRWKFLYAQELPALAKAKDPVQPQWPVYLDHCMARIVLDNAVGQDRPWTEVVKSPAVKHMTEEQLKRAIKLAEKISHGEASLAELDERSLELRGKKSKSRSKRKVDSRPTVQEVAKKPKGNETISSYFLPSPESPQPKQSVEHKHSENAEEPRKDTVKVETGELNMSAQLRRIANSDLTPFRKQTLSLLCGIPRGRHSTYQAMSDYITKTSHKTCARAVGNAMRNNPFAPEVPCHRILAADGSLGGFGGHWGEQGKFASKKHDLLNEEGVKFDSKGKVKGPPFREWT